MYGIKFACKTIYSNCAMTGSRRHICSAPLTGSRFRQKCRIISGIDLKGLLNWPSTYSPVSFCCCIRMCMKPLALLDVEGRKIYWKIYTWCGVVKNYSLEWKRIILFRWFAIAHQETSLIQLPQYIFSIDSSDRTMIPTVMMERN